MYIHQQYMIHAPAVVFNALKIVLTVSTEVKDVFNISFDMW